MSESKQPNEITVASERIYTGRVVNLRVDTVVLPGGKHYKREIVEHRGAVAIAALDDEGNVIMVRQFRKAAGKRLLELPAGTMEAGEDPSRCAARELEEETGFRGRDFEHLASFYTSPGFCTELLHVYLATDLVTGRAANEPDEQIEVLRIPLNTAIASIPQGDIVDAKTIVGLLMVQSRAS